MTTASYRLLASAVGTTPETIERFVESGLLSDSDGAHTAVGALSIINTMAMSVAERTREIGIKRAIGAGDAFAGQPVAPRRPGATEAGVSLGGSYVS